MSCSYRGIKLHFFPDLTEEEFQLILPMLQHIDLKENDTVISVGAKHLGLFLIVKGKVRREMMLGVRIGTTGLETWQEKELFETRSPGQFFGEEALISNKPALEEWVVLEDAEFLYISQDILAQIQQKSAVVYGKILQVLSVALFDKACKEQSWLAASIENKKLVKKMRIERKKNNAMHRIAQSTSINNVNQTLDTILDACMDCLEVQKGSIMIYNRGVLRVEAAFGKNKDNILGQVQQINDSSVSGRCFLTKKPIFIQNIEEEEGLQKTPYPGQYWNNSLISLPLISLEGESIGVLNVSKTSRDIFTEEDMKILEDLSYEASAALAHEISLARLYRNFQETLLEVKQLQSNLKQIEEKIYCIIQASCPIMDAMGATANE